MACGSGVPAIACLSATGCPSKTINRSNLLFAAAALAMMLAGPSVHAAGFQQGVAFDPAGKPLVIGIWYPTQTLAKPHPWARRR
jgi:hypothetical protein